MRYGSSRGGGDGWNERNTKNENETAMCVLFNMDTSKYIGGSTGTGDGRLAYEYAPTETQSGMSC